MTKFKSAFPGGGEISAVDDGSRRPFVIIKHPPNQSAGVTLSTDDAVSFAEAVLDAAGVDAVILTDLPDVTDEGSAIRVGGKTLCYVDSSIDWLLDMARRYGAAARFLESRPDPRVEKLAALVDAAMPDGEWRPEDVARALIEAGVTVP